MYYFGLVSFVLSLDWYPVLKATVLMGYHPSPCDDDEECQTCRLYDVALALFPSALAYASESDDLITLCEGSVHKVMQIAHPKDIEEGVKATEAMRAYITVCVHLLFLSYRHSNTVGLVHISAMQEREREY